MLQELIERMNWLIAVKGTAQEDKALSDALAAFTELLA